MESSIDPNVPGPLLTPDDMVALFRLPSRKALYAHVARGQLPKPTPVAGKVRRWKRETVREWIAAGGAS